MKKTFFLAVISLLFLQCREIDPITPESEDVLLTTIEASGITSNSANVGGTLADNSSTDISDVGVQYVAIGSSSVNSDLFGDDAIIQPAVVAKSWSCSLTNLRSGTAYAYRAFANNDDGIVYGNILTFTTLKQEDDVDSSLNPPYSGEWASDMSMDIVDMSNEDHYWETMSISNTINITYNGTSAEVVSSNSKVIVTTDGAHVAIDLKTNSVKNVEIIATGIATDGSLKIYSPNKYKLTLNGVSLTSLRGPAINNQGDKRTFVHLVDGTTNRLTDSAIYSNDVYYISGATVDTEDRKACLFSEPHLIFSGHGALVIKAKNKHAIASDDTFFMRRGTTIVVNEAVSDGIHTNDAVTIQGGLLNITAYSDGIECEGGELVNGAIDIQGGRIIVNSADDGIVASYEGTDAVDDELTSTKTPNVVISGGEITIITTDKKGQGIKAEGSVNISGGQIDITTKGNAAKCISATKNITISGGNLTLNTSGAAIYEDGDTSSSACLKSDANTTISNATIYAKSTGMGGKGINCDGLLTIESGEITAITTGGRYTYSTGTSGGRPGQSSSGITSSPKAIKSEGNMIINGGKIEVSSTKAGSTSSSDAEGCEGIESKSTLTINGGVISVYASDDAINSGTNLTITDGQIYCYSVNNDAIDSNGTIAISGGLVIAVGTSNPEAGFDCDNSQFKITGGVIVGIGGSTSNPTTSVSTQRTIVCSGLSLTSGQVLNVSTSSTSLLSYKLPRTLSSATLLFSHKDIASGGSYTIKTGGSVSNSFSEWQGYFDGGTYSGGTTQNRTISIK